MVVMFYSVTVVSPGPALVAVTVVVEVRLAPTGVEGLIYAGDAGFLSHLTH